MTCKFACLAVESGSHAWHTDADNNGELTCATQWGHCVVSSTVSTGTAIVRVRYTVLLTSIHTYILVHLTLTKHNEYIMLRKLTLHKLSTSA